MLVKKQGKIIDNCTLMVFNQHGHQLNQLQHNLLLAGRTRSVQVVRKQFPLRPAAAKTIHRSRGDTESRVVVNLETRRAIPHIHYVGLSRVTTINGCLLYTSPSPRDLSTSRMPSSA